MRDKNLNCSNIISLKTSTHHFFIQKFGSALGQWHWECREKHDAGTEMYQREDSVLTAPCVPTLNATNPAEANGRHV